MAACDGPVEEIRALVKEGVDVVQDDAEGFTALHYSACNGNVETVRVMFGSLGAMRMQSLLQQKGTRNHHQG
jgi:ankyrin repeat protein